MSVMRERLGSKMHTAALRAVVWHPARALTCGAGVILQPLPTCPQSQRRVGDVEERFAIRVGVPGGGGAELFGWVLFCGVGVVAVGVADGFDLFAR